MLTSISLAENGPKYGLLPGLFPPGLIGDLPGLKDVAPDADRDLPWLAAELGPAPADKLNDVDMDVGRGLDPEDRGAVYRFVVVLLRLCVFWRAGMDEGVLPPSSIDARGPAAPSKICRFSGAGLESLEGTGIGPTIA